MLRQSCNLTKRKMVLRLPHETPQKCVRRKVHGCPKADVKRAQITGTARAPCRHLAIAVWGPYDYLKNLRSSCLFQNDQLKHYVLLTIAVRPACGTIRGGGGVLRGSYNVSTGYGLTIFNFLYNSEFNKIVKATSTLRRP